MHFRVITPPTDEPVSLETVKEHLRIDLTEENALLQSYLMAAREQAEGITRRALVTQTLEAILDAWPADGIVKLPRPPLQSVTSVKYLDEDGVEQTVSASDYQVDARSEPGKIHFKTVPSDSLYPSGAIAIRYVAGYGAPEDVPQTLVQALLMTVGHWYEFRETAVSGTIINEVPNGPRQVFMNERAEWF